MQGYTRKLRGRKLSRSIAEPSSSSFEEFILPTDLLIEILKRLPLKSLGRSICVCKSWFSLLSSPAFVSTLADFNLRDSNNSQKFLLFKEATSIHDDTSVSKFSVFNAKTLLKQNEIVCPVSKNHFVVSSVDGLVCLFDFYSRNPKTSPLYLWNPSISKAIVVPVPEGDVGFTSGSFPKLIFGLGFDSSSNDYKLIRVAFFNGGSGDSIRTFFRADVYSVSTGEWRSLGLTFLSQDISTIRWRGLHLNGFIHWICNVNLNLDSGAEVNRSILTFKLGAEVFSEIKLPKEVVDATIQILRLVVVPRGGKEVLGVGHNVTNVFNLWVMEEYAMKESWVKLFSINFGSVITNAMDVAVVSEQYVVVRTSNGWISYDHKTHQICNLKTIPNGLDYVDTYVESLILLGQRKGVLTVYPVKQQEVPRHPSARMSVRGLRRGKRGRARAT